jgi:hypothetical protein
MPKTRVLHRAYDAATIPHILAGLMHTSRTCRPAPRSPTPSHHTHTRVHRHTRCDKPHPPQRHVGVMARVTKNTARQQATHRASHTHTQHTNTHVSHARTTSCTAATTAQCAHITARTPPHSRHTQHDTQLGPPNTPPTENRTQSHTWPPRHTHDSRVRLPSVDRVLPESWLLCKFKCLQDTRTAIASHHGTRRRRKQHISAHRIIKSNQVK